MQSRTDDDTHDQIGISQPASGIATPRPDLSDKRLPGIMHNFFQQNTPPQTPRGTTSAGNAVEKQPLASNSQSTIPGIPSVPYNGNSNNEIAPGGLTGTIAATAPGSGAAVGPPKGKLTVRIIEARGLRPSQDPYVVCVFEWNEYISRGPRGREIDLEQDEGNRARDDSGRVPIGAGDMGRRIAIPMKSRQSSNTSLPDYKELSRDGKATSNPKWEQEAVLYDLDCT
jgi:serine/threonine protein kinase SCH9